MSKTIENLTLNYWKSKEDANFIMGEISMKKVLQNLTEKHFSVIIR